MKWFKHDSDANMDGKLKKLRIRFGMEGYGLYWYCLEVITAKVDQFNLNFELDHDAEIIANDLNLHFDHVQEIMTYMVKLGLFENSNGTITCLKLARRLDQSMTSNVGMRNLIKSLNNHDEIMTKSSQNRTEQNRKEKIRENKGGRFTPPSLQEVQDYCQQRENSVNPQKFIDHYLTNGWMRGKTKIKCWKACVRTWESNESEMPKYEMKSKSQVLRVGAQKGLSPRPGETTEQYETRIRTTRP